MSKVYKNISAWNRVFANVFVCLCGISSASVSLRLLSSAGVSSVYFSGWKHIFFSLTYSKAAKFHLLRPVMLSKIESLYENCRIKSMAPRPRRVPQKLISTYVVLLDALLEIMESHSTSVLTLEITHCGQFCQILQKIKKNPLQYL